MAGDDSASGDIKEDIDMLSEKFSRVGPYQADECDMRENNDLKKRFPLGPFFDCGDDSDDISVDEDVVSFRNPDVDFDKIRRSMCIMVIEGGLSFHTSAKAGFREFVSYMCPHFNLPSADDLMSDALNYYNEEQKIVEDELQRAPGRIYCTVDNLRDSVERESCMCLTAHWIDCDWILQRRMIKFVSSILPFDCDSVGAEIISCLDKWKISDKVFGFTIDNPSYSLSMMASLKAHLQETNSLLLGGKFFHISCAHKIINIAVLSCLNLVGDVLDKIRSIVEHIRAFTSKKEKFYEVVNSTFALDTSKRLIGDTRARWDSTFVMLDRFLYFRDAINSFVSKDKEIKKFALTQEEWGKVTELFNFLKVIFDLVNTYLAPKTPTANVYLHVMWMILRKLSDISNNPPSFFTNVAKKLHEMFEKYWSDHCCILSCAAVFDPRYKLDRVEFCYQKLYGEEYAKEMIGKVKKTLYGLFYEYKVVGKPNIVIRGDLEVEDYEDYVAFLRKKSKVEEKSELERYLEDWRDDFDKDTDVLGYWKNNSKRFPCLSRLARDILAIPISTVAMKSRFSTVKNFRCIWRRTLPMETVEPFVCYQDWLRAKGLSKGSPFYGYNDEDIEDGSDYEFEGQDEDEDEDEDDENENEDGDGDEDEDDENENEDEDEDG